jgi:hypothetical protein
MQGVSERTFEDKKDKKVIVPGDSSFTARIKKLVKITKL